MFNPRVNKFLRLNLIRRQTQTRPSPQIDFAIANSPCEKMKFSVALANKALRISLMDSG